MTTEGCLVDQVMEGPEMVEDQCNDKGISEMDSLEWKKMCRVISQSGFREGALAGREAAFQNGFDSGYSEGFQNGMLLGYMKGISRIVGNVEELNDELINLELSKTSRGCCQLCAKKSTVTSEIQHQSVPDIIQEQRNFIHNIFKSIQNKNADFLKEWNITLPGDCIGQGKE